MSNCFSVAVQPVVSLLYKDAMIFLKVEAKIFIFENALHKDVILMTTGPSTWIMDDNNNTKLFSETRRSHCGYQPGTQPHLFMTEYPDQKYR